MLEILSIGKPSKFMNKAFMPTGKIQDSMKVRSPEQRADVDLWICDVAASVDAQLTRRYREVLSDPERDQLGRYRFSKDRQRALVSHAMCRDIISRYTGINPEALNFEYNEYGKPELTPGSSPFGLNFNLSHSQDLAVLAITAGETIGVDIEYGKGRPVENFEQIARDCFSKQEIDQLQEIDDHGQRKELFLAIWTLKESYIKALGGGMQIPLDSFSVIPQSGQRIESKAVESVNQSVKSGKWQFVSHRFQSDYLISVCRHGSDIQSSLNISFQTAVPFKKTQVSQATLVYASGSIGK